MKYNFQYIHFVMVQEKPKTKVYSCRNTRSGEELGQVMWKCGWRQYCFFTTVMADYSKGCLDDISEFISQL